MAAPAKSWRCLGCGASLGAVREGRLYMGGVWVLSGRAVCPACGRERTWYRRQTVDEAWGAVMRGMVKGLELLAAEGQVTPGFVLAECERLSEHPQGCSEECQARLATLRRKMEARAREAGA